MQAVTTIGLDIAKSVFQVHGIDAEGKVIMAQAEAAFRSCFLPEAAAVSCRYRGLRIVASLVARTPRARPHRSPDAASLCQAVREATQERCRRRRGNLRSSYQGKHAIR